MQLEGQKCGDMRAGKMLEDKRLVGGWRARGRSGMFIFQKGCSDSDGDVGWNKRDHPRGMAPLMRPECPKRYCAPGLVS